MLGVMKKAIRLFFIFLRILLVDSVFCRIFAIRSAGFANPTEQKKRCLLKHRLLNYTTMNKKEEIKAFFRNRGFDLRKTKGFSDDAEVILKALNKLDALDALELYCWLEISVLGGDVLRIENDGSIDYTGDSWHCDPREGENEKSYFLRSIDESQKYIKRYPFGDSASVLFDIVPDIRDVH